MHTKILNMEQQWNADSQFVQENFLLVRRELMTYYQFVLGASEEWH
jgi:hypothetical protein